MAELQLWPTENGPGTHTASSARRTVSTEFQVTTGTWWLKALRVYRGSYDVVGPLYGRVYRVVSATVGEIVPGTDVTIIPSGLGWQVKLLPRPVPLTTGETYRACYWTPEGATGTVDYWSW